MQAGSTIIVRIGTAIGNGPRGVHNVEMAGTAIVERVLKAIAAIPDGRVITYGGLGKKLKLTARQVASVLSHLTREDADSVPWHRVVGAGGIISTLKLGAVGRRQVERLEAEGHSISPRGRIAEFDAACI
jgi:methylated-DNA-protein-cysteine methyltransferase-like protein